MRRSGPPSAKKRRTDERPDFFKRGQGAGRAGGLRIDEDDVGGGDHSDDGNNGGDESEPDGGDDGGFFEDASEVRIRRARELLRSMEGDENGQQSDDDDEAIEDGITQAGKKLKQSFAEKLQKKSVARGVDVSFRDLVVPHPVNIPVKEENQNGKRPLRKAFPKVVFVNGVATVVDESSASSSSSGPLYDDCVEFRRGHQRATEKACTTVCIQKNESKIYSGGKDCLLTEWDVHSAKKVVSSGGRGK